MLAVALLFALTLPPVSGSAANRQPQLAVAGQTVALAFGSGESIWLAVSHDGGATFGAASKVADLPKLLLGRHRGPRVAISGNAILVSAISSTPGDLLCWRSTDGGRTWSTPAVINDRPAAAREGLHAMAADAEGHVAAVWLDDRVPGGKRLWGAFSDDGGATWGKNAQLYESPSGTICQCCHPSLAALGHGEFAAMFRNVVEGGRDLYVLHVRGGRPEGPVIKQGQGTWKLDACPMDGGGIAVERGDIVTAWRRDHEIYLARPGKAEHELGPGQDIALAAGSKGAYAVWVNGGAIEALTPGETAPQQLAASGAFPEVVTLSDDSVLAAWEEGGGIATRRLR